MQDIQSIFDASSNPNLYRKISNIVTDAGHLGTTFIEGGKISTKEPTKKEMDKALKRVAKNVKDEAMRNRGDIPKKQIEATIKRINKIIPVNYFDFLENSNESFCL